ncbi:MAG: ATP-binding protein [Gammaproteobacteria bacterium]|nr:ATP-binding protein [Gammaproteobacteria bacterium]
MHSIYRNLLLLLLGSVLITWLVASLFIYYSTQHEVEEVYDAQLAQNAKLLTSLLRYKVEEGKQLPVDTEEFLPDTHKYESKISFIVYHPDGRVMARSSSAPILPVAASFNGFKQMQVDGVTWYTYSLHDPQTGLLIQTAQRYDVRQELILYISYSVSGVMLISLPLIAILIWISIGRGLRPLVKLADHISDRSIYQLEAIPLRGVPSETRPMVEALNALFDRLDQAFEKERRFTADAAHELRTPLAGIKTQAQVALRSTETAQRQKAITQVITGVERTTKLVNQLLVLARVDAEQQLEKAEFDLKPLCAHVISEQITSALDKQVEVSLSGESTTTLCGNRELIEILITNLLNNAIRYTPEGGRITVRVVHDARGATLDVSDSGPGIPEALKKEVFDRFKRGEHQQIAGSGLGLSIVLRIAELHQATIQLGCGLGGRGLGITVFFKTCDASFPV